MTSTVTERQCTHTPAEISLRVRTTPSQSSSQPPQDEPDEPESFPDGGREALTVLFGCSCTGFGSLALLNCPGTLQAWIAEQELPDQSLAKLGWIFGFYTFVCFFAGIQIGPLFDAYGPRVLACVGSVLQIATYLVLGECKEYWQFFVTLGIMGGIGTSILLTCTISTVQLWFYKYRGIASATALCGGSIAGIVFPLMLQSLFPKIGFAWTLRATALLILPFLVTGCLLMRRRRRPRSSHSPSWRNLAFQPRLLLEPDLMVISIGVYFLEWALFIVLTYLSSYALHQNMSFSLSYRLLTYLNCGSLVGRMGAGWIGDKLGRYNTQMGATSLCAVSVLGIWLPSADNTAVLVFFSVVFGIAAGSNISLTPVCLGQLCSTDRYGRTFTAVYTVSSIGALTGIPVAGEILERTNGNYWGIIVLTGLSYAVSLASFAAVRVMKTGWRINVKF
ncbi:hypothetical protein K4F52_006096 [Lecanicillium sp. MT-2017a]|nr:hypothetical protein K4F52_006096 [Lecanicillium sp. MT-2017a]